MSKLQNDLKKEGGLSQPPRRNFLGAGMGFAAVPLLTGMSVSSQSQQAGQTTRSSGGSATDKGR